MSVESFAKTANKSYGANAVVKLGDSNAMNVEVIPTGSLSLDIATGIYGYPRGRIIVVLGDPMSGKTTLALHAVKEAQKLGLNVLYVDAEHALDRTYAEAIGVNTDELWLNQPDYGEQGLRIVEDAVRSKEFGLIIVDSVAALVPRKELEGEVGDAQVGLQARMMSQACRKLTPAAHTSKTTIFFINQYRANIATTGFGGPQKVASGGKALDYFSSMTLAVARTKSIKTGAENTANRTQVTLRKNKLASPYRTAEFDIVYGHGIDYHGEAVDLLEKYGFIERAGSWYKIDGESVAQGKPAMVMYMQENEEVFNKMIGGLAELIRPSFGEDDDEV